MGSLTLKVPDVATIDSKTETSLSIVFWLALCRIFIICLYIVIIKPDWWLLLNVNTQHSSLDLPATVNPIKIFACVPKLCKIPLQCSADIIPTSVSFMPRTSSFTCSTPDLGKKCVELIEKLAYKLLVSKWVEFHICCVELDISQHPILIFQCLFTF